MPYCSDSQHLWPNLSSFSILHGHIQFPFHLLIMAIAMPFYNLIKVVDFCSSKFPNAECLGILPNHSSSSSFLPHLDHVTYENSTLQWILIYLRQAFIFCDWVSEQKFILMHLSSTCFGQCLVLLFWGIDFPLWSHCFSHDQASIWWDFSCSPHHGHWGLLLHQSLLQWLCGLLPQTENITYLSPANQVNV